MTLAPSEPAAGV
jgi:hypothetical protein